MKEKIVLIEHVHARYKKNSEIHFVKRCRRLSANLKEYAVALKSPHVNGL